MEPIKAVLRQTQASLRQLHWGSIHPTYKTRVVSTRRGVQTQWVTSGTLQPSNKPVVANLSVPSDFLVGRQSLWAGDYAPLSHFNRHQHMVRCCHVIGSTLLRTTFCLHRLFFYSFTASDDSEGTTASRVVPRRSIMMRHGFRSKEVRHAKKIRLRLRTSHSSPFVAL